MQKQPRLAEPIDSDFTRMSERTLERIFASQERRILALGGGNADRDDPRFAETPLWLRVELQAELLRRLAQIRQRAVAIESIREVQRSEAIRRAREPGTS